MSTVHPDFELCDGPVRDDEEVVVDEMVEVRALLSQVLLRLDQIQSHLEAITDCPAPRPKPGRGGTLLGKLDSLVQLAAMISGAGTPVTTASR